MHNVDHCPLIFAHRGATAYAPENTLAAFNLALAQGAKAVEFDVKLSSDQQIIIIHDQTVDRTTDGNGLVRNLSITEIKKLDAGSYFDNQFKNERIPTLLEALHLFPDDILINIELTNYGSPLDNLPHLVSEEITHAKKPDMLLISSFNPIALIRFHRLVPEIPIAYLTLPGKANSILKRILTKYLRLSYIHPHKKDISPEYLKGEHKHNRKVNTYTVNAPDLIMEFTLWRVDGIFTDDVPLAYSICRKVANTDK